MTKAAQTEPMQRGNKVYHRPTGEEWIVLRAGTDSDGDYVEPAGWPPCRARASDCDMVEREYIDLVEWK